MAILKFFAQVRQLATRGAPRGMPGGSTSSDLSSKKFYMVVSIPKRNGISFAANEYHIFLFFWTPLLWY